MSPLGKPNRAAAAAGFGSGRLPWNSASTSIELVLYSTLLLQSKGLNFDLTEPGANITSVLSRRRPAAASAACSSGLTHGAGTASTICQVPRIETPAAGAFGANMTSAASASAARQALRYVMPTVPPLRLPPCGGRLD